MLDGEHGSEQVHLDDPHPVGRIDVGERGERTRAGVGEGQVESAEAVDGRGREGLDVGLEPHVAGLTDDLGVGRGERGEGRGVDVADHDVGTLGGEASGRGQPDARRATRDERDLAGETFCEIHRVIVTEWTP